MSPRQSVGAHRPRGFRDSPFQLVVAHRDSIPELRGSYERYVSRIAIGSAGVSMNSWTSEYARQTSLHSQVRSSNSCRRPRENSSMALTTLRSHDPQLWAPRTMPPAVGWDFTWAWRSLVLSRTSMTDHNHGGRYSPRRNRRSTMVRLWTFTGLKDTVSVDWSASCPGRTASPLASRSVR